MKQKMWILLTCVFAFSSVVLFFLSISVQASTKDKNIKSEIMATETPEPPMFTATMQVVPERTGLFVGESLDVRISIEVSEGCQYPIYELKLSQDVPLFEYLTPITHTVGPGVSNPYTYTLRAEKTGSVTFQGLAYGERYCGDYWNWRYVGGESEPVTIMGFDHRVYLPLVEKG